MSRTVLFGGACLPSARSMSAAVKFREASAFIASTTSTGVVREPAGLPLFAIFCHFPAALSNSSAASQIHMLHCELRRATAQAVEQRRLWMDKALLSVDELCEAIG